MDVPFRFVRKTREKTDMSLKHLKKICLAAFAMTVLMLADSSSQAATRSWWSPRSYRRSASSAPAASGAQANRSSQRRYSFAPSAGTYSAPSYSPSGTLGINRTYRQGPGYSPRNGINRADFKIKGL